MQASNVNPLLQQLQGLAGQASRVGASPVANVAESMGSKTDFAAVLKTELAKVNQLQQAADSNMKAYEGGSREVTLPEVMVSMQKAGIAFQSLLQVRNHVIKAYQDVMNMPI